MACRSGAPLRFRLGELSLDDTLLSDEVFHNASKGQRASSTRLRAVFGTNDQHAIAERILREGEIQLNIAEKRMLIEPNTTEKKLQENLRKNPHFHAGLLSQISLSLVHFLFAEGDKIYRGSVPTGPTPPRQVTAPARAGRRKSWTSAGVKEGKYFFLEK